MSELADLNLTLPLAPLAHGAAADPRAAFDRLSADGFRAVQLDVMTPALRPRSLGQSARRDLRAVLRRRELALAGLDVWIPDAHFGDATRVDRAVALLVETIELAADLGQVVVSTTLPGGEGADPMIRAAIDAAASRAGVRVADFTIGAVADATVGLGCDPVAALAQGDDPATVVAQRGATLTAARLADLLLSGDRGPVGTGGGQLDVAAYRASLTVAGYAGAVVVDPRGWAGSIVDGLRQCRAAWDAASFDGLGGGVG